MSSHYQQGVAHNVPSSPNNSHMMPGGNHPSQMHPYGQYGGNAYNGYNGTSSGSNGAQSHYMGNSGRDMGMGHNNGYNNNAHHPYGNNYMHRGSGGPNHGIGNTYTSTYTRYTNIHNLTICTSPLNYALFLTLKLPLMKESFIMFNNMKSAITLIRSVQNHSVH